MKTMTPETSVEMRGLIIGGQRILDSRKEWGFDRQMFLNSSEADDCIRKLWYAKHRPDLEQEQEWGFAWRGHMAEEYVVRCLAARNDTVTMFTGDDQVSLQDEARKLSATPDGIISFEGGPFEGLEIKSIDPRTNRANLPKPGHITQFKIAMALMNNSGRLAGQSVAKGRLIYIDASNYNDILEFEVEAGDDAFLDKYAKKAAKVFRTQKVEMLDREGKRDGGCKFCPFTDACGVDVAETSKRRAGNRGSHLDSAVVSYMALKDQEDGIKLQKDALKADIVAELEKRGIKGGQVGDVVVTLTTVKGRESLDKKAVAAAGIDLSPFTKVGAPSVRLDVRRAK